jgi:hypothetical protein
VVLSLRSWLFFDGTNARDNYQGVTSQLFYTFTLGDKPQFQAPCWYMPAGGGVFGFDSASPIFNHGWPSQDSILKLARPIVVPVRQNISVEAQFFSIGTSDALTLLNGGAGDDQKVISFMIDG